MEQQRVKIVRYAIGNSWGWRRKMNGGIMRIEKKSIEIKRRCVMMMYFLQWFLWSWNWKIEIITFWRKRRLNWIFLVICSRDNVKNIHGNIYLPDFLRGSWGKRKKGKKLNWGEAVKKTWWSSAKIVKVDTFMIFGASTCEIISTLLPK